MKQIRVILTRTDGGCSDTEAHGDRVTPAMLDAAEDLIGTIATGERELPKDLYDACARAFDTSRDDAKKRLLAAMYGKATERGPYLIGWTWHAHLRQLHADVREGHWLKVSKALALMLGHAINEVAKKQPEAP